MKVILIIFSTSHFEKQTSNWINKWPLKFLQKQIGKHLISNFGDIIEIVLFDKKTIQKLKAIKIDLLNYHNSRFYEFPNFPKMLVLNLCYTSVAL